MHPRALRGALGVVLLNLGREVACLVVLRREVALRNNSLLDNICLVVLGREVAFLDKILLVVLCCEVGSLRLCFWVVAL